MATKRTSRSIGPKQASRGFHAVRFSTSRKRPLNLLITIDATTLGIPEKDAGVFLREVWARVSRWWAYQRDVKNRPLGSFDAFMVHENPNQGPRHAHWFIHAPGEARSDIEKIICSRIAKMRGLDDLDRTVHFRDVNSPGGVAKYMLKGIDPAYADHFFTEAHNQGEITGRRMTISRSIGFSAREKAGWKRKTRRGSSSTVRKEE